MKRKRASALDNFETVAPHQRLAAAEREEKHAGVGKVAKEGANFHQGHFATVVVFEIAMFAALVATIGEIEMHAQGKAQAQRLGIQLLQQAHAPAPAADSAS